MKQAIFLFFLSFITLTGCQKVDGPSQKLYLANITGISTTFQTKLMTAIQALNTRAGHDIVSLNGDNGGRPLTILPMESSDVLAHTQHLDYRCLVEVDETNSVANYSQTDLQYILLHELGHCYDLAHSTDVNSVMYPSYSGTQTMTTSQITYLNSVMTYFAQHLNIN